ncbi:hypothetical protein VCG_001806 [Vibrio cholerae 12129(1)]|nr:hypothetical protein VCD_002063 [Vibrio cholerae MJ-1236]EEN97980.1 hypothetical protein VCG_001806 [Vibrio cholerae 12129(1)]EEO02879.1 hypothetical protein VCA_001867 [Vibrio cholerae VL426]EEO06154.1 hypothetical protein VIF_002769 [Vibrio cholerae TM 11079-80]EEO08956.1 hypothetical protein VCC_003322 [Vibrio cholerae RC9]EEO14058.1 hypothetical protein VCB_001565 [Vibrio cholerae TMA 21]EEO17063.1 hypothetical protein VCE_003567 [Vibrio cholerae B33]EEO20074.1 hypothetical protein VC
MEQIVAKNGQIGFDDNLLISVWNSDTDDSLL